MNPAIATEKMKEIADQFNTILFGADATQTIFYWPSQKSAAQWDYTLATLSLLSGKSDSTSALIADSPGLWELSDERVKLLGKLYLSLDKVGRNTLTSIATAAFRRDVAHRRYSGYLFTFLAKYHDLDVAVSCVLDNVSVDDIGLNTFRAVSNLLKYDSGLPTDAQVNRIALEFLRKWDVLKSSDLERVSKETPPSPKRAMYDRVHSIIQRIVQQAQEIKYRRLKEHLFNDANLEINQDRQTLTAGLAKLGFGRELIESLEHAENEYRKAESKFDFKTAVDHNRSFLEALLWETAGKVAKISNESLAARRKHPVEVREYLHKAGFFTDRFLKLCEAFYQFASEQSTHQLASGREIARVVRNMNIELGLLMIGRLESFK